MMKLTYLSVPFGALFLAALCLCGVAAAQSPHGEFKNVKAFKVQTAGFSVAAASCGLVKEDVVAAFSEPLNAAGLPVVAKSSGYWLSLRVTTLIKEETTCITYVETAAYQTTRYFNTATREERVGKVLHWVDGGLFAAPHSSHPRVVLQGFRDLGEKLAAKWKSDQS